MENQKGNNCLFCQAEYKPKTTWQKYCSTTCRLKANGFEQIKDIFAKRKNQV